MFIFTILKITKTMRAKDGTFFIDSCDDQLQVYRNQYGNIIIYIENTYETGAIEQTSIILTNKQVNELIEELTDLSKQIL